MDGISVSKEIVGLITSIGLVPAVVIFAVCLFFIFREIKKQNKSLENNLTAQREYFDEQCAKLDVKISGFNNEISYIEKNYVTKEQHYSDFEGWRAEIKDLRDLITQFLIAGGFKNGKD